MLAVIKEFQCPEGNRREDYRNKGWGVSDALLFRESLKSAGKE